MPRAGGTSAPLSAARLSSLSTSTLSKILELVRLQQSSQPLPSTVTGGVSKSLAALRSGIETLLDEQDKLSSTKRGGRALLTEDERKNREEIAQSLKKQYARLKGLCEGLGMQVEDLAGEHVETAAEQAEPLIDHSGSDVPMSTLAAPKNVQPPPHIRIEVSNDDDDVDNDNSRDRYGSSKAGFDEPYRDDPEAARLDEEEMRRANQDVMVMQRRMIDDQDSTLDQLSAAISRQRDLSLTISSELELHENLIDETDEALDRTGNRLRRASRSLDTVARKTREHGSACMIITLIVVLTILVIVIKL